MKLYFYFNLNTIINTTKVNQAIMKNNTWYQIIFHYSNQETKLFQNSNIFCQSTINNLNINNYRLGIGTPVISTRALKGFYWRLTIAKILIDPEVVQYNPTVSTCLAKVCDEFSFCMNDPHLGNICISNISNPDNDSYGEFRGQGTKTIDFECLNKSLVCTYNPVLNLCNSFDLALTNNITIDSKCKAGYSSINNQCCKSECCSCNNRGECNSWTNTQTQIINKSCVCIEGYFETGLPGDFCNSCLKNCKSCKNASSCNECFENFTYQNNECICQNQTSESLCTTCHPDCIACHQGACINCTFNNSSPYLNKGCKCNKGYWNESYLNNDNSCIPCNESCKSCSDADNCTSCEDPGAEIIEGKCLVFCNKTRTENCIRCRDPDFVYSKGECLINCTNNRTEKCKKCENCDFCYENSTCYNCSYPMKMNRGKCECDSG